MSPPDDSQPPQEQNRSRDLVIILVAAYGAGALFLAAGPGLALSVVALSALFVSWPALQTLRTRLKARAERVGTAPARKMAPARPAQTRPAAAGIETADPIVSRPPSSERSDTMTETSDAQTDPETDADGTAERPRAGLQFKTPPIIDILTPKGWKAAPGHSLSAEMQGSPGLAERASAGEGEKAGSRLARLLLAQNWGDPARMARSFAVVGAVGIVMLLLGWWLPDGAFFGFIGGMLTFVGAIMAMLGAAVVYGHVQDTVEGLLRRRRLRREATRGGRTRPR
ncbi:hypothetical protein Ga0609869_002774 [Rhodovulum iodosum]|uniref:Uncharacterized protein n=1 Tax=Rhodovulum iodosum TaxID=68291 RepID=A0ABV3XVP6_9RHOB|nr:hypothetical protein [Rhodovulum robiginosum]RSK33413.1 hypothetical protein EJA01_08915 [Rhodovulum robiginosum]